MSMGLLAQLILTLPSESESADSISARGTGVTFVFMDCLLDSCLDIIIYLSMFDRCLVPIVQVL